MQQTPSKVAKKSISTMSASILTMGRQPQYENELEKAQTRTDQSFGGISNGSRMTTTFKSRIKLQQQQKSAEDIIAPGTRKSNAAPTIMTREYSEQASVNMIHHQSRKSRQVPSNIAYYTQNYQQPQQTVNHDNDTLGEKFHKVQFREISGQNSRLNINNVDMKAQKEKRDRAINYWKDRVIQDFLPPIDQKKQHEIEERRQASPMPSLQRLLEFKIQKELVRQKEELDKTKDVPRYLQPTLNQQNRVTSMLGNSASPQQQQPPQSRAKSALQQVQQQQQQQKDNEEDDYEDEEEDEVDVDEEVASTHTKKTVTKPPPPVFAEINAAGVAQMEKKYGLVKLDKI
ncbi:hypothetical protein FGO68_gene10813 [Halteria grandinella]|uniref:Uncharacterized protein n=1 Tax=Halteria grandinella TaxID=5974 RepID=A0A8J8T5K7_HALGN|nr:hypothetical protein FGO68_gene10813 [Halteria grandinella]